MRLRYVPETGYPGDVRLFMDWGETVWRDGPGAFYRPGYFADYPPAYLYVLALFAALFDGEALRLVVKAASIPADVALALVFAGLLWRRAGPGRGALAATLWMAAPGAVIAGPYWGQVDAIGTLVVVGALVLAARRRWVLAGALGGLAAVLKFQFGLGLFVVVVAAVIEAWRSSRGGPVADGVGASRWWRPLLALPAAALAVVLVALPFRQSPLDLWNMLRFAGEEYPFTSLYAFNIWSIQPGFWKPDAGLVVWGAALLVAALAGSVVPLWWRRDHATLLAAGALASLAFYFLPTRAHERYLFPAVALLVPLAAARWRLLPAWLVLSLLYAVTLVFALARTVYTEVTVPTAIDEGVFSRDGQIWIALLLCLAALVTTVLLATVDRSLRAHPIGWEDRVRLLGARLRGRLAEQRERVIARVDVERTHERRWARAALAALVALPMLFNAVALLPEVTIGIPSNNDDANHYAYVRRADEALSRGADPLDFWVPEMEFGFPPFVHYQHLPHLAVVLVSRVTFGAIDLLTLFNLVRWLLLVTLPVTVWWSLRRLGLPAPGAALAGAAAALVSANGRFGIEYDSFVWRGWGMYTQLWAVHLAFLSLALVHDLLERGRGFLRTVAVLAALALSHLIWAYMTAISVLVLFLIGLRRATWRARTVRLALAGTAVAVLTSYMWLPFLLLRQYLNVSQPYLPDWRFDSFGFGQIATWLLGGDLLDHGRLPVLTLLAAAGLGFAFVRRDRTAALAVTLAATWLVLWSGRASLGALADLLPLSRGMHVHRFVGGLDVALVLLVGLGGAALWRLARADASARRGAVTALALLVLLAPAVWERADYYGWNTRWLGETRDALVRDRDLAEVVAALEDLPPGRVYAGLGNDWQRALDLVPFNSVRVQDVLNFEGVARLAKPYASLSLNGDLAFHLAENDEAMWDALGARYAIARTGQRVPSFLVPLRTTGRYVVYAAPGVGWVEFATTTTRTSATEDRAYFFAQRDWLLSDAPERRAYVRYDYPEPVFQHASGERTWCANGRVSYERMQADRYDALLACEGTATVVLKVSYHPNWRVTVDDAPAETFPISPGFLGFEVPAGQHFVTARYVSTPVKAPLAALGLAALAALVLLRRRILRLPWLW